MLVSRIVIGLWVRYVFFSGKAEEWRVDTGDQEIAEEISRYYIDQKVILEWTIQKNDEFGLYSHTLTDDKGEIYGLKSAEQDLNNFEGQVSIKGQVDDLTDEYPIIKITEIISSGFDLAQEIDGNQNLQGDKDAYYFEDHWLIVDLGPTEGFTIQEKGEDILLVDLSSDEIEVALSISAFACNTSNSLTDCTSLQNNFDAIGAESFISSKGIKYTNMTETNTWLAFDGQGNWFYLRPNQQRDMTSFVDLISFINTNTVSKDIANLVSNTCKNLDTSISNERDLRLSSTQKWLIDATITWTDTSGAKIFSCIYQWTIANSIDFKLLDVQSRNNPEFVAEEIEEDKEEEEESVLDAEDSEAETIEEIQEQEWIDEPEEIEEELGENAEETVPEEGEDDTEAQIQEEVIEENIEEDDGNTAEIVDEGIYAGQLSFASARGYTMYFSDKWVGYAWAYLQGDEVLTIWAANCTYGVKVIQWANIDNVQSTPDSIIYECTGEIDLGSIPWGLTYIKELDGKHFVKNDITGKYIGMEVGVVSQ